MWRLRDPEEKDASLQLRNGDSRELKSAVDWYREHDRLAIGDPVAMGEDVYAAYLEDRLVGKDALIVCDTREMADALNMRLHEALLGDAAARAGIPGGDVAVTVFDDQRVAVGDVILTRDSDNTIDAVLPDGRPADQVRNGNRWTVVGIDTEHQVLHAMRGGNDMKGDGARATFTRDYAEKHITLGYATTVHSAQGVTADTCHALMGVKTSRTLAYVAMTRGRQPTTPTSTNDSKANSTTNTPPPPEQTTSTSSNAAHPARRPSVLHPDAHQRRPAHHHARPGRQNRDRAPTAARRIPASRTRPAGRPAARPLHPMATRTP